MLSQEFIPAHRLLVGGLLAFGDAVPVVQFLRPVQAESNGKPLRGQEAAPALIQEGAVGLNPVGDAPVGGAVLALKRHDLPEIVQPQEGRLPPMPGKTDHRTGGGVDVLDKVRLQDVVRHAKRLALRIEALLLQIVTIVATQVADGANRFGEDLEFAGSAGHING